MTKAVLTPALASRGWVLRKEEWISAPILVRGVRKQDNLADRLLGFVYAETAEEAEAYDRLYEYTEENKCE